MRSFRYARPASLAEATHLLAEGGADTAVLAGGTDLIVALRQGKQAPRLVIDIKGVAELRPPISMEGGWMRISATTLMTALKDDRAIRESFPALAEAAAVVGSVQIRNRATLGGNICHASPAADTVPALLVYAAELELRSESGTRRLAIEDFLVGPGRTALRPGELLTHVALRLPPLCPGAAFARLTRRRGVDLATINLACGMDGAGTTRLAYGAVGPRAFVVSDGTGVLADPRAAAADKEAILRQLLTRASPISDVRASQDYRAAMLRVLSLRTLRVCGDRLADATR